MNCTPHCFSGRTRHFSDRCRQRRIEDFEVDLALLFGVSKEDRNELGKKSCATFGRLNISRSGASFARRPARLYAGLRVLPRDIMFLSF